MEKLSLCVIALFALCVSVSAQGSASTSGMMPPRPESTSGQSDSKPAGLGVGRDRVGIPTPTDLDMSTTRTSKDGLYRVSFKSMVDPIPRRQIHEWTITVRGASGELVDGATILVGGGMPQHGHGLPTEPKATKSPGSGEYTIEGMKFNMGGWWEVQFKIIAGDKTDIVVFNLSL